MKYTKNEINEIRMNVELLLLAEADIIFAGNNYMEKGIIDDYVKRTRKHGDYQNEKFVKLIRAFDWDLSKFSDVYMDTDNEATEMLYRLYID